MTSLKSCQATDWIRTSDILINSRSQLPTVLNGIEAGKEGLEPPIDSLEESCIIHYATCP